MSANAQTPPGPRLHRRLLQATGGVGLLVLGFLIAPEPVQVEACTRVADHLNYNMPGCPPESREISLEEATVVIDVFVGRLGGADPERAYSMLAPSAQQSLPRPSFVDKWDAVSFAERVGSIEREPQLNRFKFQFRTYQGSKANAYSQTSGLITTRHMSIALQATKPRVYLDERTQLPVWVIMVGNEFRDSEISAKFPRVHILAPDEAPIMARDAPYWDGPNPFPLDSDYAPLAAYCRVEKTNDPDASLWVRTGFGFVPISPLARLEGGTPEPCDPHYLDRDVAMSPGAQVD